MRIFGCLSVVLLCGLAAAQPASRLWLKTTSTPMYDSYDNLVVDSQRNSYVCGYSVLGTGIMMLVVKYSPAGTKLWEKMLSGAAGPSAGNDLAVDGSGNVYVVGVAEESGAGITRSRLVKLSPGGALLWERYGAASSYFYAVAVDSAGEVSATGWGDSGANRRFRTVHYLPNGTKAWEKDYSYPGLSSNQATHIGLDSGRNVYVAGNSDGPTSTTNSVAKYSPSGALLWVRHVDNSPGSNDYCVGFQMDGDNCALLTQAYDGAYRTFLSTFDANGVRTANYGGTIAIGVASRTNTAGLVRLADGSFLAYGVLTDPVDPNNPDTRTTYRAIFKNGSMTVVGGYGNSVYLSSCVAGLQGAEYYFTGSPYALVQPCRVMGWLPGYPSGTMEYSWREILSGSSANGQSPSCNATASVVDAYGDLIVAGRITGSQQTEAFIAKYECLPVAFDDTFATQVGQAINTAAPGLRSNDRQASQATLSLVQSPLRGALTLNNDGSFTYAPDAGFAGTDRATYKLTRTNGTAPYSSSASVDFTVYPTISSFAFDPASIKGGQQVTMRVKVATRLSTNLTLPVSGYSDFLGGGNYNLITIPKESTQGENLLFSNPTSSTQVATFTVRSGTSTRSTTLTITP